MLYCSWDMVCDRCNCYFSFWAIFCPFIPLTAQKIKILKKWKNCLEISSFYICVPKIMIRWCMVTEIWCTTDGRTDGWTDGRTDGWKKWHIEGVPHLKKCLCIAGFLQSGALYATTTHDPRSEYNQQKSECSKLQQSWEGSGGSLRCQWGT